MAKFESLGFFLLCLVVVHCKNVPTIASAKTSNIARPPLLSSAAKKPFVPIKPIVNLDNGNYKIENGDKLFLTIQGSKSSFATAVTEQWLNGAEQKWEIVKYGGPGSYQLLPQRYRGNNYLSFYRDAAKKYPVPETWSLLEVASTPTSVGKSKTYQLQNNRTKLCLASVGRRKAVNEVKCDHFARAQHWRFTKF